MTLLYQAVAGAVARAARPLLLSGDCATALGAVAGLQRRHRELAVVWLDAHGDFNTPAITISGYLGGMPLAMLTHRSLTVPPGTRRSRGSAAFPWTGALPPGRADRKQPHLSGALYG
jgi:arginase family enzyme